MVGVCFHKAALARANLADLQKKNLVNSGDQMQAVIKKSLTKLLIVDSTFRIENSLLDALSGQGAELRTSQKILQCLPTRETEKTTTESVSKLETMMAETAMQMAPMGVKSTTRHIIALLKTLESHGDLDSKANHNTKVVRDAWQRFAFFLRVQTEKGPLAGSEAMVHLINQLQVKIDKTSLEPADMEIFEQFKFLLDGPGKEIVAAGYEHLKKVKKVGAKTKAKSKAASSCDPPAGGKKDEAERQAMTMFFN